MTEPLVVGSKTCKTCGESKSVLAFASNRTCRDGLQPHCRECKRQYDRTRRHVRRTQADMVEAAFGDAL